MPASAWPCSAGTPTDGFWPWGIVAIIFCPAILNIAVVTNAVPNSGLPLPFISFGGTNLVFTLAALGMLTSIQRFSTGAQPNCEITRKDERSIDVRL